MSSTKHLLDPELQVMADAPFIPELTDDNISKARDNMAANAVGLADPASHNVQRSEIFVSQPDGPDVRCLLYQPKADADNNRAGYLHIHGGGYLFGAPEGSDLSNLLIASKLGVTVLSVDYRLAPEHPIPAPLDDCYAALAYLHEHAEELGVDVRRIGIGGESAGGGLAAALAIKARDAGEYAVCFQALTYPMLDDRTGSEQNPGDPLVGEFVWTRQLNQYGWSRYLGDAERAAPQVPARLDSYVGLPPTWMFTATMDLFRDENIDYARRLMESEVSCDLVVYPGACHGFQFIEDSKISKRFRKDFMEALERGLG